MAPSQREANLALNPSRFTETADLNSNSRKDLLQSLLPPPPPPPPPPFYCCYLLRSSKRHASLYIGSTPHPARRLKQHNGLVSGGAKRTGEERFQPWDMVCLVSGFQSRYSALQFEHAWQNPATTRHLPAETSLSPPTKKPASTSRAQNRQNATADPGPDHQGTMIKNKISNKTRPRKAKLSIRAQLFYLSLLLNAPAFIRLPLVVRPQVPDVSSLWTEVISHPSPFSTSLSSFPGDTYTAKVGFETGRPKAWLDSIPIAEMDFSYAYLIPNLEKARGVFGIDPPGKAQGHRRGHPLRCQICTLEIHAHHADSVVCPVPECTLITHMRCLGQLFLDSEKESEPHSDVINLVPKSGSCPGCKTMVSWEEIVRELAVRRFSAAFPDTSADASIGHTNEDEIEPGRKNKDKGKVAVNPNKGQKQSYSDTNISSRPGVHTEAPKRARNNSEKDVPNKGKNAYEDQPRKEWQDADGFIPIQNFLPSPKAISRTSTSGDKNSGFVNIEELLSPRYHRGTTGRGQNNDGFMPIEHFIPYNPRSKTSVKIDGKPAPLTATSTKLTSKTTRMVDKHRPGTIIEDEEEQEHDWWLTLMEEGDGIEAEISADHPDGNGDDVGYLFGLDSGDEDDGNDDSGDSDTSI